LSRDAHETLGLGRIFVAEPAILLAGRRTVRIVRPERLEHRVWINVVAVLNTLFLFPFELALGVVLALVGLDFLLLGHAGEKTAAEPGEHLSAGLRAQELAEAAAATSGRNGPGGLDIGKAALRRIDRRDIAMRRCDTGRGIIGRARRSKAGRGIGGNASCRRHVDGLGRTGPRRAQQSSAYGPGETAHQGAFAEALSCQSPDGPADQGTISGLPDCPGDNIPEHAAAGKVLEHPVEAPGGHWRGLCRYAGGCHRRPDAEHGLTDARCGLTDRRENLADAAHYS